MLRQKERRKFLRLSAYHLAKYHVISGVKGGQKVIVPIKDISGGGFCLLVDEELPVSTVIQVYIQFPGITQPIPCLAKVLWKKYLKRIKRYQVGAQFIEIEEILRREIVKRIDDVCKRAKEKRR